MPYCRICEVRRVPKEGDVCETCRADIFPINNGNRVDSSDLQTATHDGLPYYNSDTELRGQEDTFPTERQHFEPDRPNRWSSGLGNSYTESGAVVIEGIVRNIHRGTEARSGLRKWIYCFIHGIPYSRSNEQLEFQVFRGWDQADEYGRPSADRIVVFGTIDIGNLADDNTVRVYGKRLKNHSIIASKIENTTDGTVTTFSNFSIPAGAVRVITATMIVALMTLLYAVTRNASFVGQGSMVGATNIRGNSTDFTSFVVTGIIVAVAAVFCFKRFLRNIGQANFKKALWILLGVLFLAYLFYSMIVR